MLTVIYSITTQKLAQLDSQGMLELLDITLLFVHLRPKVHSLLGNMDKVDSMWDSGTVIHPPTDSQHPVTCCVCLSYCVLVWAYS